MDLIRYLPETWDKGFWHLLCNWKEVNILIYVICQGREGEIRHIFRGFAFLHCKKLVENGGMFVCKARHLVLAGGSKVGLFYTCGQILCFSQLPYPKQSLSFVPKAQRCDQFYSGGLCSYESTHKQSNAPRRRW